MLSKSLYNFVKNHNITRTLFISYFTAFVIIFYFILITIFGEKGFVEYLVLKKQIENKEHTKQELLAKRNAKKNMVDGMNLQSLDIDLLDEQARKVLGYAGKNEVVLYQDLPQQNIQKENESAK